MTLAEFNLEIAEIRADRVRGASELARRLARGGRATTGVGGNGAAESGGPDWPGVTVKNVYFDITPARLVSAWIDETGVRRPNAGQ